MLFGYQIEEDVMGRHVACMEKREIKVFDGDRT
jgi:hypothetical protein